MNLLGYRSTLALIAVLTIINCVFFVLFGFRQGFAVHIAVGFFVGFGLWMQSKFFRYVGAIWAALSVGSVIWPLFSLQNLVWNYGLIWVFLLGILSAFILNNLLFSKKFSGEFTRELKTQPPYKKTVWKIYLVALILAAVIASAIDIYNLATS